MSKRKFWTEERVALVRELAPKMSAALIAVEVGAPSRNAVVGLAYREGIELTGNTVEHRPRHRNISAAREPGDSRKPPGENLQRADRIVKAAEDIKRNVVELQQPPEPIETWDGFVSLFDLMNHHCRSIECYEGPIAFFCGRPKFGGTSWCEKHAMRYCPGLFQREA